MPPSRGAIQGSARFSTDAQVTGSRRPMTPRSVKATTASTSKFKFSKQQVAGRLRELKNLFEEGLLRLRLPYLVVGGVGFYERKEVKDVLAYLRLVLNPRDSVAFHRVVNVPPRGLGSKSVEEIDRAAAAAGSGPAVPRRVGGRGVKVKVPVQDIALGQLHHGVPGPGPGL